MEQSVNTLSLMFTQYFSALNLKTATDDKEKKRSKVFAFFGAFFMPFPAFTIATILGIYNLLSISEHSVQEITDEEMLEFYDYLAKNPMLGYKHPIGKTIYSLIALNKCVAINDIDLYRARCRRKDQRPYIADEIWSPPVGVSGHGRYNQHGLSVLYTCNSIEGALSETHKGQDDTVDIIEWHLIKEYKMLDLSREDSIIYKYCSFPVIENKSYNYEYLVPNYIAQCCFDQKIDGIIYKSVKCPNTLNYVFFKPDRSSFEDKSRKVV